MKTFKKDFYGGEEPLLLIRLKGGLIWKMEKESM